MQASNHQQQYTVTLARNVVMDATGTILIYIDDLPQVLTYNGPNGKVDTITIGPDEAGRRFRQTMTYTAANVTGISSWQLVTGA